MANFDYTTFIIVIIILFNLSFLQISFSIEQINNNQIGNVTEKEIKKVVNQDILYSKLVNNKTNVVVILPSTNNETIYNGIITYSSNQPVILAFNILLITITQKLIQVIYLKIREFFTSLIYPDYIVKEKIYSSSLSFVGSALTINYEKPFF